MKFFFSILFISLFISFSVKAQDFSEQKEITKKVIAYFESGQFAEIYTLFDTKMKSAISAQRLDEIWNSLPRQCGKYIGSGEVIASEVQGMVVVNQLLDFEQVDLDIRLAINSNNRISGLFFVPPVKKKA